MRIFVAGAEGQVATCLKRVGGETVETFGRARMDLLDADAVQAAVDAYQPDVVINAAAYTAVDKAETDRDAAFALNATGAETLARATAAHGCPILHLSTDYVFDGSKPAPYSETDPTGPLGVYGQSKLAGEQAVAAANLRAFILRTAWVYSPYGANFLRTMLNLAASRPRIGVVADQLGNPTSALAIAEALLEMARSEKLADPAHAGVYHLTAQGEASWADFATEIFRQSAALGGPAAEVDRITTAEFPRPAPRPANSRLNCDKLAAVFGLRLPDWRLSMTSCLRDPIFR